MNNKFDSAINAQHILSLKASLAAEKFAEAIRTAKFPQSKLTPAWKELAYESRDAVLPMHLRISLKEFAEVMGADLEQLNYFQVGCLCNAIEAVGFVDTTLGREKYLQAISDTVAIIEHYQLEINKIRAKIEKDVEREVSMRMAAERGASSGNTGTEGTGAVKAIDEENKGVLTMITGEA